MNAAVGVRSPAAVLVRAGRRDTQRTLFSHFMGALKKSRRHEARIVIARYAHLLPLDHPSRRGTQRWKP